jgi:glycosyltransferase involved in cell wall biosynthesis
MTPGRKSDRAKVVHLTTVHSAGDPRIFRKECRSLARAGFSVTVIGPYESDVTIDSVKIRSLPRERSRVARMTRLVWKAYRVSLNENADIYHFHDPELLLVGLFLRMSGKRVIYDAHEDLPKDVLSKHYIPSWCRGAISQIVGTIEAGVSSKLSALVAVTPSIADRLREINPRTVVVHNFPCADELAQQSSGAIWSQRRMSVAYVGGITVLRAMNEMVAAMSLLPTAMDATLELAGPEIASEADSAAMRRGPGWKRVRYYGFIDQPSTFELLHNVRAGLVLFHPEPSHFDAMPQKIFEYMAAGLPIIASDFPLWRKIMGDTDNAIFVDPQNPAQIAEAIEYLLTHPHEAEEMGLRGQAAVSSTFNWNGEARKLIGLYEQIESEICAA